MSFLRSSTPWSVKTRTFPQFFQPKPLQIALDSFWKMMVSLMGMTFFDSDWPFLQTVI